MFGLRTLNIKFAKLFAKLLSLLSHRDRMTANIVSCEFNGVKAMKAEGFPTMIQAGSSTYIILDLVVDNPRLRKISETDDEYNERMKLLDEQENNKVDNVND